jgi:predicted DNA-binding ribbon-helix-helix protein
VFLSYARISIIMAYGSPSDLNLMTDSKRLGAAAGKMLKAKFWYSVATRGNGPAMKVSVKRSVVINGRKTSVSLEEPFWRDLKEIADSQGVTLSNVVTMIDRTRRQEQTNLSSAIRLFVLEQIKNRKSGAIPGIS